MASSDDIHDFEVVSVEPADETTTDRLAIILVDARGGRVRLHLPDDLAESLRERLVMEISKRQGP